MTLPLSTPEELADEPELAPLEVLQSAAEVSRRAILAAHPELGCRAFVGEEPEISSRQCMAAGLLATLEVIIESVENYRAHLDHLAFRRLSKRDRADDIPF
jgi:2-oxo-4-hydroxy-4-carboxy--5-ureidoimidazoline (OHCU) decarboxylase